MRFCLPLSHRLELEKQIQLLRACPPSTPITIGVENCLYVVKFNRRESGRWWRESLSAALCGILFGLWINPKALRAGDTAYEAQRLAHLQAQGIAVPHVFLQHDDHIVMEHTGRSIETLLNHAQHRNTLLIPIMQSLVDLHEAGQWHGGAQVRNLTLKDQRIWRIDFEEKTGDALPLHLAQAYDLLLCFNSLTKYLAFDVELGQQLLSHYLQQRHQPALYQTLQRVLALLLRLKTTSHWLTPKQRCRSDLQRTLFFTAVLERTLAQR